MTVKGNFKARLWLLLGCCVLVICFIIKPWQLYFLNDDFMHIPDARLLLRSGFMRPVPNVFLWVDKMLYGHQALGFFMTAMILHTACVFSVFFITKKIADRYLNALNNEALPFVTAILFLVYPWHAEVLMWVISRGSIIACLFTLGSFYFYIDAHRRWTYLLLSWLLFVLALFSYESMWNAVLFYGLFSWLNVKRGHSVLKRETVIFGVMASSFLLYLGIRVYLLDTLAGDGYVEINENLNKYGLLAGNWIKLIARNYTPPFENSLLFTACFAVLSLLFLGFVVYAYKKSKPVFRVLLIAIAGVVSSVITAAPLGIDTHFNESERYLYYSSFFLCFFLGIMICNLPRADWRRPAAALLSLLFSVMLFFVQKNYQYASTITRTAMEETAKYPNYKRAIFVDVPVKYKGSLIFRICLQNGLRWINPSCAYDSIEIYSQDSNVGKNLPYKTGETEWFELAAAKDWSNKMAVLPSKANSDTLSETDILFWFKADGFYRVNFQVPKPHKTE